MRKLTRVVLPMAAAAALIPVAIAAPAQAEQAQAVRWSYLKALALCGKGYKPLGYFDLGPRKAMAVLAYKGRTKCAVTVRDAPYYGHGRVRMGVRLTVKNGKSGKILGYRSGAAGPIRYSGKCVKFGGTLNTSKYSKNWICK